MMRPSVPVTKTIVKRNSRQDIFYENCINPGAFPRVSAISILIITLMKNYKYNVNGNTAELNFEERVIVKLTENRQHDILLVITSLLFIIFAAGLAVESEIPVNTTVIPPS